MVRDVCDVKIIDSYSGAYSIEDTLTLTLDDTPDIVGISFPFTKMIRSGLELARQIKAGNPEIGVIAGGIAASLSSGNIKSCGAIDCIARYEAENTIKEIVDLFGPGGWGEVINSPPRGTVIRNGDEWNETGMREPITDLDSLPFPAFDLLEGFPENYNARLITSRGCSYQCPYCTSSAYWGKSFRAMSPERVCEDMERLNTVWGIKRVSFSDDTFNLNPKRAARIAELLIERKPGMKWGASCRPELLSTESLELYSGAGMTGLFLGLESGSPGILEKINRYHDLDRTRELVRSAVDLGIEVHASFMIGLPDETGEDIEKTLEYAKSLKGITLGFHVFHPLPGSEFGDNPDKYGLVREGPKESNDLLGSIDSSAPFRTKYLGPMQILDYYYMARSIAAERLDDIRNQ